MIILTNIRDVATAWKDTAALTFDPFVQQLMTTLGMSKKTQETLFQENPAFFVQGDRAASLLVKENPMHHAFYHLQME